MLQSKETAEQQAASARAEAEAARSEVADLRSEVAELQRSARGAQGAEAAIHRLVELMYFATVSLLKGKNLPCHRDPSTELWETHIATDSHCN